MPGPNAAFHPRFAFFFAAPLLFLWAGASRAHDGHGPHAHAPAPEPQPAPAGAEESAAGDRASTSGQGEWTFRWSEELSALPEGTKKFLPGAHGGFAIDRRGKGEVYFGLKGCGIIKMSPDLRTKEVVEVDPFVRSGNFHNTTVIYDDAGVPYLALPDDERQRVYVLTTAGKLVQVLSHPKGNAYYDGWGPFVPTDVEQAPNRDIYIVTGYSPGDFVVTADAFTGAWKPLIFGGKGTEHGKFGTGHGITWNPVRETLDIADRPNSRIESYDLAGKYLRTSPLPAGSLPCDVSFLDDWTLVGCLNGPGGATPAPVYVLDKDGGVVSTIRPKEDFRLGLFDHVHNAAWHSAGEGKDRKVYILCQAWSPGGFAVLERTAK
jgi:hypothetical protein